MKELPLKEIMTRSPITINIESDFSMVDEYFRSFHIRHLPVVDDNNVLKGIITQRDLYRLCSPRKALEDDEGVSEEGLIYDKDWLDKFILKQVMTKDPLSLGPEDTFARAVELMIATKYGCIPIVDNERKIVGIVTQIDILKVFYTYFIKNS